MKVCNLQDFPDIIYPLYLAVTSGQQPVGICIRGGTP